MRRLTIIIVTADPARLHGALSIAAAQVALGRAARLFFQGDSVALLRPPIDAPDDDRFAASGLPRLGELLEEALSMGVECDVCQSGLALASLSAEALPSGVTTGGLIGLLADAADDQLLLA
jgi:predicted peroxiredoxin